MCAYLGCKMHDCVNLLCLQDVTEQVPALNVTFDELQQMSVRSDHAPVRLAGNTSYSSQKYILVP